MITGWLKQCAEIRIPIIPKLTAAVTDIRSIGEAVAMVGADGICAINTIPSLFGIDLKALRPLPDIGGATSRGACVLSCREGGYQAVTRTDSGMVVDPSACSGCSLCVHVCPEGAVGMERVVD